MSDTSRTAATNAVLKTKCVATMVSRLALLNGCISERYFRTVSRFCRAVTAALVRGSVLVLLGCFDEVWMCAFDDDADPLFVGGGDVFDLPFCEGQFAPGMA